MNNSVNLFFACDDGYVPFLAVTLHSIKENATKNRKYNIRILNTGIREDYKNRLLDNLCDESFEISFPDISNEINKIGEKLHTRDYYSKSTYYRLFIPALYPELDKALYLDCDIVLCSDVAELYDVDLGENLVGAIADSFVSAVDRLHGYVMKRIGVDTPRDYFNAGVLLMNLKEMRDFGFEEKFIELLGKVTFTVAQDQDYLNVICGARRSVIGYEWNCMPGYTGALPSSPKLIHYNIDSKPWHKEGVEYADIFWENSDASCFACEIRSIKEEYADAEKSVQETVNLIDVAEAEAGDEAENMRIKKEILSVLG